MVDRCYICYDTTADILLRPCINKACKARVHRSCLEQQYNSNNKICGICRLPILVNITRNHYDMKKILKYIIGYLHIIIFYFIMFIALFTFLDPMILTILVVAFVCLFDTVFEIEADRFRKTFFKTTYTLGKIV